MSRASPRQAPDPVTVAVPIAQIVEWRAAFAQASLQFEIEMSARDPFRALAFIADRIGACGFSLVSLRLSERGWMLCRLRDRPGADLATLDAALRVDGAVSLERWTTLILDASP